MTEYRFVLTPYDPSLADELSRALEKRTELSSRKKYPGLWRQTDRLHAYNERTGSAGTGKGRKIFRTVLTIVLLLLGLFLLIPGLMDPKNLKGPLIVGILAVSCALFRIAISILNRRGQKRDPRYDAAKKSLQSCGSLTLPTIRALFFQRMVCTWKTTKPAAASGWIPSIR